MSSREEFDEWFNKKGLLRYLYANIPVPTAVMEMTIDSLYADMWMAWQAACESQATVLDETVKALREIQAFLSDVQCAHPDDVTALNKWMERIKSILAKYQEGK